MEFPFKLNFSVRTRVESACLPERVIINFPRDEDELQGFDEISRFNPDMKRSFGTFFYMYFV